MAGQRGDPAVEELLGLAIAEPDRASRLAQDLLTSETDPWVLSIARQTRGVVQRDRGFVEAAVSDLRAAVKLARASHDGDRTADARASLGLTLTIAGRTRAGLEQLQRALDSTENPTIAARTLMRRGHALYFLLFKPREALADLERALPRFRSTNDRIWEARTLNVMGLSYLALGQADLAADAVEEAEEIFAREGQVSESVVTVHNRALIAWCRGDLPGALRLYDEAGEQYAALGEDYPGLVRDHCEALLAAGLAGEAVDLVRRRIARGGLPTVQHAELMLTQATAELADDDAEAAAASASQARVLFRRQRRDGWAVRAELVLLLARHRAGQRGRRLVDSAISVADRLEGDTPEAVAVGWLLAGRMALATDHPRAGALLDRAAAYRYQGSDLVRATGWQARALRSDAEGRRRGVLDACRRGLAALHAHQASLGSSELRALSSRHGDELAALAMRHALGCGPRVLLEWTERWRATALSQPPVRPLDDEELARDLSALRDVRRRIAEARGEDAPISARLEDDRVRLERAIRRRRHHLRGTTDRLVRFEVEQLVAALGDATFVEITDIDGTLHALVADNRRVRHLVVGSTGAAEQAVPYAQFALRQAARGRPADLDGVGRRLQDALLGNAVKLLGDGPVVISPPSRLHAAPWPLMPSVADLPVSVAPSAALWLRARSRPSGDGTRVLVAGPGLESGGAEIDVLARSHPEAVLLKGGEATVERTLEVLDGATVAHVAAHGRFRDDSPMFSSLDLEDGPLTVHDLERLDRAPYRMVLSACESGVMAPIGAGELLGLVAAMLSLGSAGVVSSVARVNDQATGELMLDVHEALDEGVDLGQVLLRARQAARGDQVHEATAAAFLAMGA
jgi:tetratricopeptide (TPR) repeat protein